MNTISVPSDYSDLSSALQAAQPGQRVLVGYGLSASPEPGSSIVVPAGVTLQGGPSILDGQATSARVVKVDDGATLEDMIVQGSGQSSSDAGVEIDGGVAYVHNNSITGNSEGILIGCAASAKPWPESGAGGWGVVGGAS